MMDVGGSALPWTDHPRQPGAPVAVVGIGCRLPGANSAEALWEQLCRGVDATRRVPRNRFPGADGRAYDTMRGGFLDDVESFDADFFGIATQDAEVMDPQQRVLLPVAWEALEDAGILPAEWSAARTAVYVGQAHGDNWDRTRDGRRDALDLGCLAGTHQRSMLAGRLSYHLGLHGPSVTVDAAQASSLAALHLACLSLRADESALALAGGANLILGPDVTGMFDSAGVLSEAGHCAFGDAGADGFVRSDGVAVVVLKRLDRALADGGRVRAVILGSALSHDGADKDQLLDPSRAGQARAMRWAYEDAGIAAGEVDYVEAHGTGTRIDAVELGALNDVLAQDRRPGHRCLVGSAKSNIGHTEAAAGVVGVIKTALCLQHGQVPPSLHHHEPSPAVDWARVPLAVPTSMEPLGAPHRRPTAAVNGQSISGVNAHVVLTRLDAPEAPDDAAQDDGPWPLTLTAPSRAALDDLIRAYAAHLAPDGTGRHDRTRDICWTATTRRTRHAHRLTVHGADHAELRRALLSRLHAPDSSHLAPADAATEDFTAAFPTAGAVVTLPAHPWRPTYHPLINSTDH
ncbi:polyketide synthase [Streptomyces lydicus]|uniref:polyketide synthase n=1 Tax=Streptomyces lydicus TaxID=47763 RepID=UPI0036B14E03